MYRLSALNNVHDRNSETLGTLELGAETPRRSLNVWLHVCAGAARAILYLTLLSLVTRQFVVTVPSWEPHKRPCYLLA